MSRDRAVILLTALVVACGVLLGQIRELWLAPPVDPVAPVVASAPGPRPQIPAFPTYAPPPMADFKEAFARPAFSRERRPRTVPRETSPGRPLRASLKGIIHIGEAAMALLSTEGSRRPAQVGRGQTFEGWRLDRIHATRVELSQKGQRVTLTLPYPGHPPQSPGPRAAPPHSSR